MSGLGFSLGLSTSSCDQRIPLASPVAHGNARKTPLLTGRAFSRMTGRSNSSDSLLREPRAHTTWAGAAGITYTAAIGSTL